MTDDSDHIFVRFRGRTLGPLTAQRVQELVRRGQITRMHELSPDGLSWSKAEEFGNLFRKSSPQRAAADTAQSPAMREQPAASESPTAEPLTAKSDTAADPEVQWYAHIGEESKGPVSTKKLLEWVDGGLVDRNTLVWRAGFDSWQPAEQSLPQRFNPRDASVAGHTPAWSGGHGPSVPTGGGTEWAMLAVEMNRRRGWALFFAILLVTLASILILAQIVALLMASGNSSSRPEAFGAIIGALTGLAIAGTLMYAGILIIRYCNELTEFGTHPTYPHALKVSKRLSTVWAFCGIASLVWLVLFVGALIFMFALGIAVVGAFT